MKRCGGKILAGLVSVLLISNAASGDVKKEPSWMAYVPDFAKKYLPSEKPDGWTEDAQFMGPTRLKGQTFDDLKIFGPASLDAVTVKDDAEIAGPVVADGCTFKDLKVHGPVTISGGEVDDLEINGPLQISNAIVKGKLSIRGPLRGNSTTFKDIFVTAEQVHLSSCKVKNITVKKNDSFEGKTQILTLSGDTVVLGDITFKSGNGVVQLEDKAKVSGEVEGAIVKRG